MPSAFKYFTKSVDSGINILHRQKAIIYRIEAVVYLEILPFEGDVFELIVPVYYGTIGYLQEIYTCSVVHYNVGEYRECIS